MQYTSAEILFEKFEVIETYKKDTHTSVYLANHILLGKKIILKTLNTKELPDSSILERFKREAKILAKLDHPNVIKVLDFGMFKNFFYISFEFFESRNLRKFLQTESPDIDDKRKLTVKLLKALNVAHQNNIIHRDIKPENILVNDNLELKIADFGLALIQNDTVVTHPSSIVGTPGYMSPEQIRGEKLTMQSDLFSAGVLIYEIWSGKNPFIGKDVGDTINKILNYNEKELFAGGREQFPPDIQELLEHLLKKNSSKRVGSAQEALKTLGVEATLYDIQVVELKKPVNKYITYTVPGLLVLLALIGLFYFTSNDKNPEELTGNKSNNTAVMPADSGGSQSAGGEDIAGTSEVLPKPGRLFIDCTPWADVYINGRRIDTTPLKDYIELRPGDYQLRLSHPDYPDYIRTIRIEEAQLRSFEINFAEIVGYLVVNANPWGEVFINNKSHGATPLRKAVMLYPGRYNLKITNPAYGSVNKRIRVTARDTISFNYNFENPEINN